MASRSEEQRARLQSAAGEIGIESLREFGPVVMGNLRIEMVLKMIEMFEREEGKQDGQPKGVHGGGVK